MKQRDANRQRRVMYREERFGIIFNVQISEAMREEMRAEAEKAAMSQSEFARLLLCEGLKAWRASRAPKPRSSGGT